VRESVKVWVSEGKKVEWKRVVRSRKEEKEDKRELPTVSGKNTSQSKSK